MVNKLSHLLNRLATVRFLIGQFLVLILILFVIFPLMTSFYSAQDKNVAEIDTQFYISPSNLHKIISDYTDEGRELYALNHITGDAILPLVYAFFFGSMITFILRHLFVEDYWIQRFNLFPFGSLIIDYVENLCVIFLLISYPIKLSWLYQLTSLVITTKWLFIVITIMIILICSLGLVLKRVGFITKEK